MGFRYLAMRVQHDSMSRRKICDLCMLIKVKNQPLILFEYKTLRTLPNDTPSFRRDSPNSTINSDRLTFNSWKTAITATGSTADIIAQNINNSKNGNCGESPPAPTLILGMKYLLELATMNSNGRHLSIPPVKQTS